MNTSTQTPASPVHVCPDVKLTYGKWALEPTPNADGLIIRHSERAGEIILTNESDCFVISAAQVDEQRGPTYLLTTSVSHEELLKTPSSNQA